MLTNQGSRKHYNDSTIELDLTLGIILSQLEAVVCKVLIQAGRGSLSRLFCLIHQNVVEQSKDTRTMKMWKIGFSDFPLRQPSIIMNSKLEEELINLELYPKTNDECFRPYILTS